MFDKNNIGTHTIPLLNTPDSMAEEAIKTWTSGVFGLFLSWMLTRAWTQTRTRTGMRCVTNDSGRMKHRAAADVALSPDANATVFDESFNDSQARAHAACCTPNMQRLYERLLGVDSNRRLRPAW